MSCFEILSDYVKKIGEIETSISIQEEDINSISPIWIIEKNNELVKLCRMYQVLCCTYKHCIGDCFNKCDNEILTMMTTQANEISNLKADRIILMEKSDFLKKECDSYGDLYVATLRGCGAQIASLKQLREDTEKSNITKIKTCNIVNEKYKKKIEELQSQIMSLTIDLDIEHASVQVGEHELEMCKKEYSQVIDTLNAGIQQRDKIIADDREEKCDLIEKSKVSENRAEQLRKQLDDCMEACDKLLENDKYTRIGCGAQIGSLKVMIEERDDKIKSLKEQMSESGDKYGKSKQLVNKLIEKTGQQREEIEKLKMEILKAKIAKMREMEK